MNFLYAASLLAREAIYSFHKSATREHVIKKAKALGLKTQVIAGNCIIDKRIVFSMVFLSFMYYLCFAV